LIPAFILTVTLVNRFTPDDLFAHAGDKDVKTVIYLPTQHNNIVNQDGDTLTFSDTGDSILWLGGAQNPRSSYLGIKFEGAQVPRGAKIKSAILQLYSTEAQWVKLNVDIYADAAILISDFSENATPASRTLTQTHDKYANDLKWDEGKYYEVDVTNSVTEYLTVNNPDATEIALVMKNALSTQWGRKFFSTNIDNPAKVPTLTINYTLPGSSTSSEAN
jgi:hypothetical protein